MEWYSRSCIATGSIHSPAGFADLAGDLTGGVSIYTSPESGRNQANARGRCSCRRTFPAGYSFPSRASGSGTGTCLYSACIFISISSTGGGPSCGRSGPRAIRA
jgi:hypothetical protein